jgi:hypothetical protein
MNKKTSAPTLVFFLLSLAYCSVIGIVWAWGWAFLYALTGILDMAVKGMAIELVMWKFGMSLFCVGMAVLISKTIKYILDRFYKHVGIESLGLASTQLALGNSGSLTKNFGAIPFISIDERFLHQTVVGSTGMGMTSGYVGRAIANAGNGLVDNSIELPEDDTIENNK